MSIAKSLKLVAMCVVAATAAWRPARAESIPSPSTYMGQALAEMMAAVRLVTDRTDLGYDNDGICVAGLYLQEGESYTLRRPFKAGVEYVLLAGGDEDAQDVDLQILDDNGKCLANDTTTKRMAMVHFSPSKSGSYRIRLRLYESTAHAFCSFAVMCRGGYDVPVGNLIAAGDEFLEMCDRVAILAAAAGMEATFPLGGNRGAVWGCVLKRGESKTIFNIKLGNRESVFLAAGDVQAGDIDLFLQTNDHRDIASDTDPDANPMIVHRPSSGELYRITVKNVTPGGGPSLVLFGVLQVIP